MTNFEKFKEKYPESAKDLLEMSKEEILNHYALEVEDKDRLEEFKNTYDDYLKDLESIVNAAKWWLQENGKNNHYLHITAEKMQLIQKENIEREWI